MIRLRVALLLVALAVVAVACSEEDAGVELGEEFTLELGQTAQIPDAAIEIIFSEITNDSRCPEDAQCVVAGDVTVLVVIEGQARGPMGFENLIWPGEFDSIDIGEFRLRVLSVQPDPPPQEFVPLGDYRATFVVDER